MNIKKLFKDKLLEEIIKLVMITAVYLFFSGVFYSQTDWKSKLGDSVVIILTAVVYFLILNIIYIFKKPIYIDAELKNFRTGRNSTELREGGRQRQDYSTVILEIKVGEINSAWSRLALKIVRKKHISLLICVDPPNCGLSCQPSEMSNPNISLIDDGFLVDITDVLVSNLGKNVPLATEYNFIINRNRDIVINKVRVFPIKPTILYGGKPLGFMAKLFVNFNITSECKYHTVEMTA